MLFSKIRILLQKMCVSKTLSQNIYFTRYCNLKWITCKYVSASFGRTQPSRMNEQKLHSCFEHLRQRRVSSVSLWPRRVKNIVIKSVQTSRIVITCYMSSLQCLVDGLHEWFERFQNRTVVSDCGKNEENASICKILGSGTICESFCFVHNVSIQTRIDHCLCCLAK